MEKKKRVRLLSGIVRQVIMSYILLISNFRRVLNIVCFFGGNSPASEFYADVSEHSVPSS